MTRLRYRLVAQLSWDGAAIDKAEVERIKGVLTKYEDSDLIGAHSTAVIIGSSHLSY